MIWIQMSKTRSLQAFGANVAQTDGKWRLYIERTAGNSHHIYEGDYETAMEHKEAIDWSIENGHPTYKMYKE